MLVHAMGIQQNIQFLFWKVVQNAVFLDEKLRGEGISIDNLYKKCYNKVTNLRAMPHGFGVSDCLR